MTAFYAYPDGHLSLHITANFKVVKKYEEGEWTMFQIPVEWDLLLRPKLLGTPSASFQSRPLQPGDQIGFATANSPRLTLATILKVGRRRLHEMPQLYLEQVGQTVSGYPVSWDAAWGPSEDGLGFSSFLWEENPEVYHIEWKPQSDEGFSLNAP